MPMQEKNSHFCRGGARHFRAQRRRERAAARGAKKAEPDISEGFRLNEMPRAQRPYLRA